MSARCSFPMCPFTATRQTYAVLGEPGTDDPWSESSYVAWCAGHAPRDAWPLVESEDA